MNIQFRVVDFEVSRTGAVVGRRAGSDLTVILVASGMDPRHYIGEVLPLLTDEEATEWLPMLGVGAKAYEAPSV